MEFSVLGTIEAYVEGRPTHLGHIRQRCVLAALLVDANRAVAVDDLVERVWADRAPQRVKGTLYGYLSRLRQALSAGGNVRIVRQPGGYLLEVDPHCVDLHRFRDLVGRARTVDDQQALALLEQALGLWRGEPFATVDTPWFSDLRQRLEQERFAAELDRTDIRLRRGLHGELLPVLTALSAEHPLDERLAAQLMLALFRNGRPAEALNEYQSLRRRLADELGVHPGPSLRELHQQILTGDPTLIAPSPLPRSAPHPESGLPTPRQLPACPQWFTGRTQQLAQLDKARALSDGPDGSVVVIAIGGSGGVGKTRLALHWAYQNLDRFPDGQLYVDLHGFDPSEGPVAPAAAVRGFLHALGVESGAVPLDLPAQIGLYRSMVQERRMLIVLDNAADTEQVAALLPGGTTCTVLVTSRRRLAGLASAHGAQLLTLDVLTDSEARELLDRHLGKDRTTVEPEAVTTLLERCAGLPLAISVVAARAAAQPNFPLALLAGEFRDESARLDALDAGDLTTNVRAAFAVSYRALSTEAAEVFRLVGLAPGREIGEAAVASLVARPVTTVRRSLRELENAHLLQQPAPNRYRLHDLTHLYAAERAREESGGLGDDPLTRLMDFYLHTARTAARHLDPHRDAPGMTAHAPGVTPLEIADRDTALAWFTTEHPALLSVIDMAARTRRDLHVCQLAWVLETFFDYRGHWHDWVATQYIALGAAHRLGDDFWKATVHRGLGNVYTQTGRLDAGHAHLHQALDLYGALGDEVGQAHAHRGLGWVCDELGRRREGLGHAERALALYRQANHRAGEAKALNNIGWLHILLGEYRAALHYCAQAVDLNQEIGDPHGEAGVWDSLGYAHHHLAEFTAALDCYQRALQLVRGFGDRYGETEILNHIGDTQLAIAAPEAARCAWQQALEIAEEIGHPATAELHDKLDGLLRTRRTDRPG